jgi:hypothetical protein
VSRILDILGDLDGVLVRGGRGLVILLEPSAHPFMRRDHPPPSY